MIAPEVEAPEAAERVLSTLNRDGSRRWLRPKISKGRFYYRRLVFGWFLIAVFTILPWLKVNGKPVILLDIVHREFTFIGQTFYATDTILLMLFMISVFVSIFLFTAVLGRVWCGWACPQTVYLEFLYRPIQFWLEGSHQKQMKLDREGANWRRVVKYGLYIIPSCFLAHTFIAYFVGVDQLWMWLHGSPLEHPTAFAVMGIVTIGMYLDFGYFREQVCVVMCPYGRLQSALLDRDSVRVAYDETRGNPRGNKRARRNADASYGDCIDCGNCVTTCPTGIDIRNGLQMECVNCTQCIDACDDVMEKVGKPRGLIRYASQNELEGKPHQVLRPRTIIYPAILIATLATLVTILLTRQSADVSVLRAKAMPFEHLEDGRVRNRIRVQVRNVDRTDHRYTISVEDVPGAELISAQNPLDVASGAAETAGLFVLVPDAVFENGKRSITVVVRDEAAFEKRVTYRLLGPWRPKSMDRARKTNGVSGARPTDPKERR